jgi:mono/diheme cytochrome c family protein
MPHDTRTSRRSIFNAFWGAAWASACGALLIAALAPRAAAQQQAPASWTGAYSPAQAKRGEALYAKNCVQCHSKDLTGSQRGPAVAGPALVGRWSSRPLGDLLSYIQTQMPWNSQGGLTRQQNADILAFMLQRTGVTAGAKDLWVDGPSGRKTLPQRSPEYGKVAAVSTRRAQPLYTLEQAERGRVAFDKQCAYCHSVDPKLSTPKDLLEPLPSTFGGHFIERVVNDKVVYPTALALFSKLESMPGSDTRLVSDQQRVDIVAYLLQANGLPAGDREIPLDHDVMRLMMLNEPGFEPIFNGNNLSGWNFVTGSRCPEGEDGCAKYEPGNNVRVENGMIVCECSIHGYMYTDKQYKNFTLRFDTRFERPRYYAPEDDDELFSGGNGYFIHADFKNGVGYPRSIEIEGRHRDILEFVAVGAPKPVGPGKIDLEAKRRAIRPLGQWQSIEISSINGHIRTKLNGVPVSENDTNGVYNYAGHILFQTQGAKIYWRNLRVRVEPEVAR